MVFTLLLVLGCWFLLKKKTPGLHRFDLVSAWGLKIVASCVFLWIYTHYYGWGSLTADPEAFMNESALLARVASESPADYFRFLFGMESPEMVHYYLSETSHWSAGDLNLINDSKNVIRANSLLHFISAGNSYVHLLVFSFLSLLGLRELYLAFHEKIAYRRRLFWLALVGLPCVLFWTGSMLKEPLLIVGFCLVIRAVFGRLSVVSMVWRLLLGILLMLAFKPYVLLCLLPAIAYYFMAKRFFTKRLYLSLLPIPVFVMIALLLFPEQRQQTTHYLTRKQFDFINIGRGGLHAYADTCFFYFRPDQFRYLDLRADSTVYLKQPVVAKLVTTGKSTPFKDVYLLPNTKRWYNYYQSGGCASVITVTEIRGSFGQLIQNVPEAFVNAAFRPFFGDPGGVLKFPAIIETILLFGGFLVQFRYWKRASRETKLQVIALLTFAALLFVLIGWITPVLGAIVRYRIPAYLAVAVSALILHQQRKVSIHE